MKKLLSKVFFYSDCAKGATLAFTLFTVGNYLWFSLFLIFCFASGRISMTTYYAWLVFVAGVLLITLYALISGIAALVCLVKILRRERRFKALWYLLSAVPCLALGVFGIIRVFPPLNVAVCCSEPGSIGPLPEWMGCGFPGLAPGYWAAVFFLSLLLVFAGGLLPGAACAAAQGRKIRSAFGRATLALWGFLAAGHIFFLALALHESRACSAVRQAVEKRFGRPLSATGVEAMYLEGGKVDAEFWARCIKFCEAFPTEDLEDGRVYNLFYDVLPDRPAAETLAWFDRQCRKNRVVIERLEKCFDAVPPLPEKKFVPGKLYDVWFDALARSRPFADWCRSRLIAALAAGDVETAWACYRRMSNFADHVAREPFFLGFFAWCRATNIRCDCIEKLLESRLLSDDKLEALDADLAAVERDIPHVHERAIYSEAAFCQDVIYALEEGLIPVAHPVGKLTGAGERLEYPGAFAPYRWIFPLWWYHFARDNGNLLKRFLFPDFRHVPKDPGNEFYFLSLVLFPVLAPVGDRFYALTARARGMRALIRAEKYRRKHGKFPKTLPDLPEDPFSGKPLVYEMGKAKITETVWEAPVRPVENTVKTTVDAVSVRSPAALPRSLRREEEDHYEDATRAMIRY